jgi:uncharacterized protein YndB with AHSA1/START domain
MTTPSAQVSTEVETSLESAWKALTNPEVLGNAFFGSKVETTWQVGSPILFRGEHRGFSFEDRGEILSFSPPKQLRFSHWTALTGLEDKPLACHVVTIELLPGAKTKLRLTQEDGKPVDESTRRQLTRNWSAILAGLKRAIERVYGRRWTG